MGFPARVLSRFRRLCLSLPEVEETETFGHPTFRAGRKTFAVLEEYKGEPTICFKATLADQALLTMDPRFFVAPYVGRHGWTSMRLKENLDWEEIEELLRSSYQLVATARMRRALAEKSVLKRRRSK